jgi:Lanthionine synthetase C-like protein
MRIDNFIFIWNKLLINFYAQVVMAIIASGKNMAAETTSGPPLMYEWHGKKYLGAAHGIAGILFVLIQVKIHKLYKYEICNVV